MAPLSQLPLSNLVDLCRVLRHSLDAGIPIVKVFGQQARSGLPAVRPLAALIHHDLERGDSLETALQRQEAALPPLFLALAAVGEQAGQLPEIFGELERYFALRQRLRRQFRTEMIRPVFQYVIAVLVIAFLIWVLGLIAESRGGTPIDPLGVGLVGGWGALVFIGLGFGIPAVCLWLYRLAVRTGRQAAVEARLLRVPVLGPCLEALALTRFCLALRLTQEAGMMPAEALGLSLRASDSAAFTAAVPRVQKAVRSGQELTQALSKTRLLPDQFVQVLAVAEQSGQLPAVMRRQSDHYRDEAERRLKALTRTAAFLIWAVTAAFIAWAIFRIFINVYMKALEGT
jgi:type IV pilus assembly protein PilC